MLKFSKEIENVFKSKLELVRQIDVDFLNDIIGMDLDRNSQDEFLAQYIIVSPILRKLFNHNLINLLDEKVKSISDVSSLSDFYNSIDYNSKDRQTLIISIFEFLIRAITPRQQEKFGVVYTPIEVVDFINQSVSDILDKDFGCSLKDVEVLDPFTGVGIFLERLNTNLKCGYEIMPLSCFIARLNTNANIKLVDTFTTKFKNENTIKVIIGNPPYSVGQKSANDNNPNDFHEYVSKRLKETYVKESSAQNKNRLYDLYIKSFRWASDNLGDKGIIAFVTNGSWIFGNSFDGMRKYILDEFDTIYIYDLKGNARTSGVQRQREGGKLFGGGSRCPIAITFLVRNPKQSKTIKYDCVDGYLTREQKLEKLKSLKTIFNVNLKEIKPDVYNDWFKKRDCNFSKFIALGSKKKSNELKIFKQYSLGVLTSRDTWCYNSNPKVIETNMTNCINFYNAQVDAYKQGKEISYNKRFISWDRPQKRDVVKGKYSENFDKSCITTSLYRPFFKQYLYYNYYWNARSYQNNELFPLRDQKDNLCICVSGKGAKTFSVFASSVLTDFDFFNGGVQTFPRYLYKDGQKINAITDESINHFKQFYNDNTIDADSIFYYIYGILHSNEYREKYANNLVKELPRIPLVKNFNEVSEIGKKLADLHVNYENAPLYNKCDIIGLESNDFRVEKLRYATFKGLRGNASKNKSEIVYNKNMIIKNIPLEVQNYIVNNKSALDWVVERYCVKTDKDTGIVNDTNDYKGGKYIFDLILRIITVSLETNKLLNTLHLKF